MLSIEFDFNFIGCIGQWCLIMQFITVWWYWKATSPYTGCSKGGTYFYSLLLAHQFGFIQMAQKKIVQGVIINENLNIYLILIKKENIYAHVIIYVYK